LISILSPLALQSILFPTPEAMPSALDCVPYRFLTNADKASPPALSSFPHLPPGAPTRQRRGQFALPAGFANKSLRIITGIVDFIEVAKNL
jgi:hypothetical protein